MEVAITQKFIHTTPRKLRLVAAVVRKMSPIRSLDVLSFTQKAATSDLISAIKTALASAKQKNMGETYFKALEINEGPKMRRFRAGSKGRALPYKKRMSHIKIVLADKKEEK